MMDPTGAPVISEHPARARLLELKRRLSDLKLEALRRGYGLEPADPPPSFDDLDTIVAEVTEDVEQQRAGYDGLRQPRSDGGRPAASRA